MKLEQQSQKIYQRANFSPPVVLVGVRIVAAAAVALNAALTVQAKCAERIAMEAGVMQLVCGYSA